MKSLYWICLACALPATAAVPDRYKTIIDRNAFALRPIEVVTASPTNSVPDRVEIKLSGFATIDAVTRAYFVVENKDDKKVDYIALTPGEQNQYLELVQISVGSGEANIKRKGVDRVLSLKNDGVKGVPTGAPMQIAGVNSANPISSVSPVYGGANKSVASASVSSSNIAAPNASPASAGHVLGGYGRNATQNAGSVISAVPTGATGGSSVGQTGGVVGPVYNPNPTPSSPSNPGPTAPPSSGFPGELHDAPKEQINDRQMTREEIEARLRELRQQHGHPASEAPPGPL